MRTLIKLLEESANKFSDNVYLWQKAGGAYRGTTYGETRKLVHEFAAGLMNLGLKHGDRVTLLAEGRNEWVIGELGVLYNGGISVPLSVKLNEPEEIAFRLKHSGSRYAITSGRQIRKITDVWSQLKDLEMIICLDRVETNGRNIIFFQDIVESGRKFLVTGTDKFIDRYSRVREDDYANICYTSGTTADPKGIILSHRNYTSNIEHS
jgi:long-chain acyl-CoA synthetase